MHDQRFQRRINPQSRRFFLTVVPVFLAGNAVRAQTAASPFVGKWKGAVPGIGDAELIISAVRQNGSIEGTMGFGSQDKVVTFGEKLDISRGVSQGLVVGSTLKIETAMGGEYQLSLSGDVMSGSYIRGTTYKVPISFKRS